MIKEFKIIFWKIIQTQIFQATNQLKLNYQSAFLE